MSHKNLKFGILACSRSKVTLLKILRKATVIAYNYPAGSVNHAGASVASLSPSLKTDPPLKVKENAKT